MTRHMEYQTEQQHMIMKQNPQWLHNCDLGRTLKHKPSWLPIELLAINKQPPEYMSYLHNRSQCRAPRCNNLQGLSLQP